MNQIEITNNQMISAIYYALLQNGYDYFEIGRSEEHTAAIKGFITKGLRSSFFADTRQNTCETYPYWPRAALLESATLYLNQETFEWHSFNEYESFVMSANNIQDQERTEDFWKWVNSFPIELEKIISSDVFQQYFDWETNWIREQERSYKDKLSDLQNCLDFCIKHYNARFKKVQIVLSAIKCVYSCDYHTHGENFIFSSGGFSIDTVLHEYLHHIVHPIVANYKNVLVSGRIAFDGIDSSYYLSDNKDGLVNAFEEYAVRCLTKTFTEGVPPTDLTKYIKELIDNSNTQN